MCKFSIPSHSLLLSAKIRYHEGYEYYHHHNLLPFLVPTRCGVKIFSNYAHKDLKFSCHFHHVCFLPLNSVKITCFILPHSQISERGLIVSLLLAAHDVKQRYGETEAALLYIFMIKTY